MTEVNTSMYNTQPVNPLTQLSTVAGTMNQLNQNKLFQSTFSGQQAMGKIFQQSVDPNTGMFNPAIAMELGKSNPNAAFIMPDLIKKGLEVNQQKQQNQISAAQLTLQHAPILQSAAMSVYNNPKPTQDDVRKSIIGLVDPDPSNPSPGKVSAQEAVKLMQDFSSLGDDPQAIRNMALDHAKNQEVVIRGAKSILPDMSYQDVGGSLHPVNTNPMSSSFNANQPLAKTLTPDTKVYNQKGQAKYIGQQPSLENQAEDIAGQKNGMNASDLTVQPNDGAIKLNGKNPNPPSAEQFAEAPPGSKEAANAVATDNASQAMTLQRAAATVPQQKAILGQMEGKLGDFSSGPAANTWKTALSAAQQIVPGLSDMKSVASQEDFNKMASMIAQQQFQSLGGTGTDAKLDSAMSTSPNSFLSNRGNKEIIHLLKGNADALSAMNSEWQKAQQNGMDPQDFGKFQTQFNKEYDPRAFQLQYMTPDERRDLLKGMSNTEQEKFKDSVNTAGENGWIPDPRKQNAK